MEDLAHVRWWSVPVKSVKIFCPTGKTARCRSWNGRAIHSRPSSMSEGTIFHFNTEGSDKVVLVSVHMR